MAKERILWSGPALEDLRQIREYIRRDNPAAAKRLAERIRTRVLSLRDHPEIGRFVPELPFQEYREIIVPPYRIVYKVHGKQVVVLRVWHGRRDLAAHPPE